MFKYKNNFNKRRHNKVLTHKNNTQFSESNEKKKLNFILELKIH